RIFNWFMFILSTIGLIGAIVAYSNEVQNLFAENEPKVVDELYTVKGIYYGPFYHVKFNNGDDHLISKKNYVELEEGDRHKVLLNNISLRDLILYTTVAIVIFFILIFTTYLF